MTDKPTVDLNLDAYKSADDLRPFVATLGGKPYQLRHIDELPAWDVLEGFIAGEAAATRDIVRMALGDKFAEFRKHPITNGAFKKLVNDYMAHCGVNTGE